MIEYVTCDETLSFVCVCVFVNVKSRCTAQSIRHVGRIATLPFRVSCVRDFVLFSAGRGRPENAEDLASSIRVFCLVVLCGARVVCQKEVERIVSFLSFPVFLVAVGPWPSRSPVSFFFSPFQQEFFAFLSQSSCVLRCYRKSGGFRHESSTISIGNRRITDGLYLDGFG